MYCFKNEQWSRVVSCMLIVAFVLLPLHSYPLPQGEQVVAGSATFDRSQPGTLNVNQATGKMIANYNSFSIAHPETVNFHQPSSSSVALNRVVGIEPSAILGKLTANGKIFLVNPNGILFGQGSVMDTAGMVASTLNISDSDFLAGRYTFYGTGGSVVNQGYISSPGGYVALLGSTVQNSGVIEADLGTVALASGEAVTLNMDPRGLISVVVDEATTQNLENKADAVKNSGTIKADGGKIILTAKALDGIFDRVVNNEGIIEAKSLQNSKGYVYIHADGENALASTTGTIDVSALEPGADGGYIEICGIKIFVDGNIDASSLYGKPGELLIDPLDLYILSGWTGDGYDPSHTYEGVSEYWLESQDGYNITLQADRDIYFGLTGHLEIVGWKWGFIPILDFVTDNELNLANFDTETFRMEAGRNIYLDNDSIVTGGGNIALLSDYNRNNDGGITWNPLDMGGLYSHGGSIVLGGADVRLAYGSHSATVDAAGGTVYIIPSTNNGLNGTIELGIDDLNPYTFDLTDADLDAIVSEKISIGLNSQNPSVSIPGGTPYAGTGNIDVVDVLTQGGKTLSLNTQGSINDANSGLDIETETLILNAFGNIGYLEIDADNLYAYSGGYIDLFDIDDLTVWEAISTSIPLYIKIKAVGDLNVGYISDPAFVSLTSQTGSIRDVNGPALNIVTRSLKLQAAENIGNGFNYLNTEVKDLWARSDNGSIYLKELSGITLHDIKALGSTIDIVSGGNTYVYNMTASGNGIFDPAVVKLTVNNGNMFVRGPVRAVQTGYGQARIDLAAEYNVDVQNTGIIAKVLGKNNGLASVSLSGANVGIKRSMVTSDVNGSGTSNIMIWARNKADVICSFIKSKTKFGWASAGIYTGYGKTTIKHSKIIAETQHNGQAKVKVASGGDITVDRSEIKALVNGQGHSEIEMDTRSKTGDIRIINRSKLLAMSRYGQSSALVDLDSHGKIRVQNSTVKSLNKGWGQAAVDLKAKGRLVLAGTIVKAKTFIGESRVKLASCVKDIIVRSSNVIAKVKACGRSEVNVTAGKNIKVKNSKIKSIVKNHGHAEVNVEADRNIMIKNSKIVAKARGGLETALVDMRAGNKMNVSDSVIRAKIDQGPAIVKLSSGDDMNLQHNVIEALSRDGLAAILFLSGGNINAESAVQAISEHSFAGVAMLAAGDIYAQNVLAQGNENLDAISALESLISCWYMPTDIVTQYSYDSAILLGALHGDVTLGYLDADMVLAAALLGNINDASIYDEVGDVYAHYLGMLAYGNIGIAENPVNTFVDIVSAYSWGEGDVYINEYDDIEIGLYLPILQLSYPGVQGLDTAYISELEPQWEQTAAIGASVAAHNGIVYITAGEDIIVNSIISPRGGVFLESQQGSIYAGQGWCPSVYLPESEDIGGEFYSLSQTPEFGMPSLLRGFLMEGWSQYAQEGADMPDYFSPVMFGSSDLPAGPNVIAGGASYFSTPEGTIGVGIPGSPQVYNPLEVCIQVVPESHSALPEDYSPPMVSTPWGKQPVGLTLNIGGSTADTFKIDTGDGNGPLGVSGMIKGIVRPGVTAVSGVYPSPALYPTNDDPLYPSGYVFYEDTDAQCCSSLYGPAARNQGMAQIWPRPVPTGQNPSFTDLFAKNLRAYYEILNTHRIVSFLPVTPSTFYAYHPLTPMDMAAFDGIDLDVGAYDFINDNIDLKKKASSYYGITE